MTRKQPGDTPTAAVVAVMDRDSWTANTDNIVVADAARKTLTWIPRDLWSKTVGDRINTAYASGGDELLRQALGDHGLEVGSSVVVLRSAVERALRDLHVTVPVTRPRRYWYPLEPTTRLEDGRKLVAFDPPLEDLRGERLHQWIGARSSAEPRPPRLPDLDRIARQQVLVRRLLEDGFDFSRAIEDAQLVSVCDSTAFSVLAAVTRSWRLRTFRLVRRTTIDHKQVLVSWRSLRPVPRPGQR